MVLVGGSSSYAGDPPATKATGGGFFERFDPYPSDEEVGQFSITINPEKKSPRAVIHVDGPELRAFWGGPLVIKDTFDPEDVTFVDFGPESKPGQVFPFVTYCPALKRPLVVLVFAHDNLSPGYNSENPEWSDWFYVFIEELDGDKEPFTGDDKFRAGGIVIKGNIMDHRK